VLESESVLDIHHYSLLYKPCWLSRPSICARVDHTSERARELDYTLFLPFYPYPLQKSVCGKLLITSSSVLLFSFEVPWKNIKKNSKKKKKETKKESKKQETT
jgi:hypothetical protein